LYRPVQANRLFTFETKYNAIPWDDFPRVVDAFRVQLEYWYLRPGLELKNLGHSGFAIAALACLLIDCLSQYESGELESRASTFKAYLRKQWPELGVSFSTPINASFRGRPVSVEDAADAIYHGLRCGILHEAHVKLYTGLFGQTQIAEYHPSGLATYKDGTDCPVVTIDPDRLFDAVSARLSAYLDELKDRDAQHDPLRRNFKLKFESSYGVAISISV